MQSGQVLTPPPLSCSVRWMSEMTPHKAGEMIGNGLVAVCRLTVFIIILHFAIKYW